MSNTQLKFFDDVVFKQDAYEALKSQFQNQSEFEMFYSNLKNDQIKDDFLRVGSAYLFFVKSGDWHVNVARLNPVIDYFTNSFKLVSTLSIAEDLSNRKHIDFFQWLNKKVNRNLFPIKDEKHLQKHYEAYKTDYGSIHNVKDFFNNLSTKTKDKLCKLVTVNNKEIDNIEDLIKLIYQARSSFAHSTKHTLGFGSHLHFSGTKTNQIVWRKFKFEYLLSAVEEGIVLHFKNLSLNITSC
ncbi:MAG: hypothetical protein OCD00_04205 [Colwellia sp.]